MADTPQAPDWEQAGPDAKWYAPGVLGSAGWWRDVNSRWWPPPPPPSLPPTPLPPADAGNRAAFDDLRAVNGQVPALAAWNVGCTLREPDLPVGPGRVELWAVQDPKRPFAAAVYDGGGTIEHLVVAIDRPDGVLLSMYSRSGESSHHGPAPARFPDLAAWEEAIVPMLGTFLARQRRHEQGGAAGVGRTRVGEDAAFREFAARSFVPRLSSWRVLDTIPVEHGSVELWVAPLADGVIQYAHLAAGKNPAGAIVAILAVETMPSTHDTAYLGAFVLDDESHHNLGEAGHLIDMRAFVPDAVETLGNLLRKHAEGTQGST